MEILKTKHFLPKDIINYCIAPFLQIDEEKVKELHKLVNFELRFRRAEMLDLKEQSGKIIIDPDVLNKTMIFDSFHCTRVRFDSYSIKREFILYRVVINAHDELSYYPTVSEALEKITLMNELLFVMNKTRTN